MSTKYTLYTSNGSETFAGICRINSVAAFDVIRINDSETANDLLDFQMSGETIPAGYVFKVPVSNTGLIDSNRETYETHEVLNGAGGTSYVSGFSGNHNSLRGLGSESRTSWKDFNCSFYVLLNGVLCDAGVWSIPVYPQEFSDNNSANFNSQSILGRSVDYQIYHGSSRNVNLTLNLHNELCDDYDYIHELVAYFESACYPGYSSGIVQAPEVCLNIGSQFKIRGILESCSVLWKAPIIDGKMVNCDVSMSIKETTGPYASYQIRSKGGRRG